MTFDRANDLDAAYASAAASDANYQPTKTVWKVNWDNGYEACGTFQEEYATEQEADRAAAHILRENRMNRVWNRKASTEAIEVEVAISDESLCDDAYADQCKSGLDHKGRP